MIRTHVRKGHSQWSNPEVCEPSQIDEGAVMYRVPVRLLLELMKQVGFRVHIPVNIWWVLASMVPFCVVAVSDCDGTPCHPLIL